MKRIGIFCDGTWNTPDALKEGKLCPTNVVKLANSLSSYSEDGVRQILYYDSGVGSSGNFFKRIFDGATGTGITKKLLQAYLFVINNYEPGDELFFFGFSRGAFTVRSLAGLIRNSGILKSENTNQIDNAYQIYRSRRHEHQPKETEATLFRKTYAVEETTQIKFIGVWDTVGSLGNPLYLNGFLSRRNLFHDTGLSSKIENAYQALAIDEKRKNFSATLWHQKPENVNQVLEQVWFSGVHSDVGGGYPDCGLSDISLEWMLQKAIKCNLSFENIITNPDPFALKHESHTGFYKLIPKLFRPIGKNYHEKGKTNESISISAMERFKNDESYRPNNLAKYFRKLN